jgi:autotransporter passenger strand-loop-strand repeat protein
MVQVDAGGLVSGTNISGGGIQNLYGGIASSTSLSGITVSGVSDDGEQSVQSGSITNGVTIGSGGFDEIGSGGSGTTITVLSGGALDVEDGGSVSGVTVESGGLIGVWDGSTISGLTLDSGAAEVFNRIVQSGGVASGNVITSGAAIEIDAGGLGQSLIVSNGGEVIVNGSASGITISAGGYESDFSFDTGATLIGAVTPANSTSSIYAYAEFSAPLSAAYQYVEDFATDTTISSGGYQDVVGAASNVTILSGGVEEVDEDYGGSVSGVTISSGGELVIYSGGDAGTNGSGGVSGLSVRAGAIIYIGDTTLTSAAITGDHLVLSISPARPPRSPIISSATASAMS